MKETGIFMAWAARFWLFCYSWLAKRCAGNNSKESQGIEAFRPNLQIKPRQRSPLTFSLFTHRYIHSIYTSIFTFSVVRKQAWNEWIIWPWFVSSLAKQIETPCALQSRQHSWFVTWSVRDTLCLYGNCICAMNPNVPHIRMYVWTTTNVACMLDLWRSQKRVAAVLNALPQERLL